ncbi:hypothetical protein [Wolbachia endosymbiont of Frankliniella intonsa]|uniref:hypothetical protein n=1 Tax=Wolbachia endosymbiont of Frankliniella intonsa TaxID=2902422 RepID=UPI00244ECF88|nr:hypothetical protein [Wolbachia endosymbiont of Frankliniella intonsa]WGJ62581.1 hypothetical protein M3L71_03075 [Wolbachia endosymbiont of Frankliniella intonsa]
MQIIDKMKEKVKNVRSQGYNFVTGHKGETIVISLAVIAVASLTAAYFLSPAYATFVGTVGTKAETLVSPAITAMSAFAVAHPLIASLVVLAAVAAIIAAPMLAYKNNNKASQIEVVKQGVLNACQKEDDNPKVSNGNLEFIDDANVRTKFFDAVVLSFGGAKAFSK